MGIRDEEDEGAAISNVKLKDEAAVISHLNLQADIGIALLHPSSFILVFCRVTNEDVARFETSARF